MGSKKKSEVRIYRVPTKAEVDRDRTAALGISTEAWDALLESERKRLQGQLDALRKKAARMARSLERERHYASVAGMTVEDWRNMSKEARKAKKIEIDAADKAERRKIRQEEQARAAIATLKGDDKKKTKKAPRRPAAGGPGVTRYSTIIGLMESPSNRKWYLFLREGPYWNYLVNYVQRTNILLGRRDRVEEAVMNACEKIGKFLMAKRYEYPEEGKGYFRGFIKKVAFRAALDLHRQLARQEQVRVIGSDEDAMLEFDKTQEDMEKAKAQCKRKLDRAKAAKGIEDEIPVSEHDLDVHDASAGLNRDLATAAAQKKKTAKLHSIASLDDNPFSDDESPANYDPADFFDFMSKVSQEDLAWVQKLQIHVLYIALGHVLTNAKVSADRREMLRLRYGLDMEPKDIHALPRFSSKTRNAFDVQMKHATDELRKEAASWWELVAPDQNDFADETVMKFWRQLGRADEHAKLAIELQDKANETAGRIK